MNYLAHAHLSFNEPEILTGNMISDFVKGKKKFTYSAGIQKGIELHRFIDEFTDHHPVTRKAKEFFKKDYRLYSGAFIDIVYDHFLAKEFSGEFLKGFSITTYTKLQEYFVVFPERFQKLFPYMKQENWLYNYRSEILIEKSFRGLVYRAKYMDSEAAAIYIFHQHYEELKICFYEFYPDLYKIAKEKFDTLIND
jgi:acyl carrier protein phosphodiesterase